MPIREAGSAMPSVCSSSRKQWIHSSAAAEIGVMPHRQSLLLLLVLLARYFQHQKQNLSPLCLGIIEPTPEEKQALQDRCGCEVLAADHFYLQFVLQSADQNDGLTSEQSNYLWEDYLWEDYLWGDYLWASLSFWT